MKKQSSRLNSFRDFLGEVATEAKKSTWPTRSELIESTVVVFVSLLSIGLFVGLCDWLLVKLLRFIIPSG